MKTPNLFDVPKTHPTRKELISAFNKANGIETWNSGGPIDDEFPRWIAAHMPSVYRIGYGVRSGMSLGECSALVGRLMEEAGYCDYGHTEAEAVRKVCKNVGIVCTI